jgi:predicted esterase
MTQTTAAARGRLLARPRQAQETTETVTGLSHLGLDRSRDALLYVPQGYQSTKPAPLAVMLHGAGGNAQNGMSLLQVLSDATGIILLAPASRRDSWDIIVFDRYGPDVAFIDQALTRVFEEYAVDPARLAIGGFSDGASYALSLGLNNGDLFTHVIAFSPGFAMPAEYHGKPQIYISHGIHDRVLPIEPCSRRIVPRLERAGYQILYHEFDGPHTVPVEIGLEALEWFTGQSV